jgi:hypothetical protein
MPDHLARTLAYVRKHPGCTSFDIAKAEGGEITHNGATNRLDDLVKTGHVTRQRDGKFFQYTATKPRKKTK